METAMQEGCCAAVRGATIRGTVGLLIAAASLPAIGTAFLVFGWFAVWREDFLALCSFALFPFTLLYFSLSRFARSIFFKARVNSSPPSFLSSQRFSGGEARSSLCNLGLS